MWSWWQEGSIHRSAWPTTAELDATGDPLVFVVAAEVVGAIRKAKSEASVSMRAEVAEVVGHRHGRPSGRARAAERDVSNAGVVADR